MVALETPAAVIGSPAPDFKLPGTDGASYNLSQVMGLKGLLVIFLCNHCPYVQKQLDRMIQLAKDLKAAGIGVVGISSNDAVNYPEDSFDSMKKLAQAKQLPFPYLYDESQEVAKAYGAVCTPDFFGYNAQRQLQYRGRLDTSWLGILENPQRELYGAMLEIAETGKTIQPQNPSIGCSIKWKEKPR
jgi:peroxiredoxin